MTLLLDSHTLLWWLAGDRLSDEALAAIADPGVDALVSAASIWELEIEAALGKLRVDADLVAEVEAAGFDWLPIQAQHAREAARLPARHRDPFDRMLIAQARLGGHTIVTRDAVFAEYGVPVLAA